MKVFVDGIEVKCQNEVKIVYEGENESVIYYGKDIMEITDSEMHLTINGDGVAGDIIDRDGNLVRSAFWMTSDLVTSIIDDFINETEKTL